MGTISTDGGVKNSFDVNEFIIFFLFFGLIIGTVPFPADDLYDDADAPETGYWYHKGGGMPMTLCYLSNFFMLASCLIPLRNMYYFICFRDQLVDNNPTDKPYNFNGRPNKNKNNVKGSDVDLHSIMPFWKLGKENGEEVCQMNEGINAEHPKNLGRKKNQTVWYQKKTGKNVKMVYTGPRYEDIFNGGHSKRNYMYARAVFGSF